MKGRDKVLRAANFWREVALRFMPPQWPGMSSTMFLNHTETLRDANAEAERKRRSKVVN
jgi:hypothetical protein